MVDHKILYSFRRCPYAMRARLMLAACNIPYELRGVSLKNKHEVFLQTSPKGTVPVLVLEDGSILDESLDIVSWAISINDPNQLGALNADQINMGKNLIDELGEQFTTALRKYKYFENYPEKTQHEYRQEVEIYLGKLEAILANTKYLVSDQISYVDYVIFPFIRQCEKVEDGWFAMSGFSKLSKWWMNINDSDIFHRVMTKYDIWDLDKPSVFIE